MYVAKWTASTGWTSEGIQPYGNLSMPPSAQVLNYGQALFEGMKALRTADDRVVLFRPLMNAQRMRAGAARMCMAELPEQLFLEGITELVRANITHVRSQLILYRNRACQSCLPTTLHLLTVSYFTCNHTG
jgi:branched-chain amino acid aminotransferase